jgi:hypothetical protein
MIRRHIYSMTIAIALATAVLMGAGVAAYAYWTDAGEGTGGSSTGTLQAVVVTASAATPTSVLLPGHTAAAAFRVTNPNHFDVTITAVTRDGDIAVSGGSGCTTANAQVTFTNQTGLDITVPANAVDQAVELAPTAVAMDSDAANGCQSASFHIPITVGVQTP